MQWGHYGQPDSKGAALSLNALHRDSPTVSLNEHLGQRQAQTKSLGLGSEERLKEAPHRLLRDADAIIGHRGSDPTLIDYHFAPPLVGRDCFATELLNDLMWRSTKRHGSVGLSAFAQSTIDLALWDLKGKLLGQLVYRLLGGPCRDKILCYAAGDDLDWSMELGFKAFKITKPVHYEQGIEGLEIIEAKVAQAREMVGPHADLMINPIMAYDVEFTIRLAERLRPYGLRWLEEPLFPEDLEGHIQIRQAITWIPLATGEDHHTRIPFRQLVEIAMWMWCSRICTGAAASQRRCASTISPRRRASRPVPMVERGRPTGSIFSTPLQNAPWASMASSHHPACPWKKCPTSPASRCRWMAMSCPRTRPTLAWRSRKSGFTLGNMVAQQGI